MKQTLIILTLLLGFTFGVNAQSQKQKAKAASYTEYIAAKMKLDDAKKTFLYETLLNNSVEAQKKKKGLSKEEKKAVSQEAKKQLKAELSKEFSKDEIKQIFALMKEKRNLDKQK